MQILKKKDILIFVPGYEDICRVMDSFTDASTTGKWNLYGLYADMSTEHQLQVTNCPQVTDQRNIIIATNVAENALTIKSIGHMIDFCLQKSIHVVGRFKQLQTEWASRDLVAVATASFGG